MKGKQDKFYLVKQDALPDIFFKVMEVKEGIKSQKYSSVNQASKAVGISRSAYYKYRNSVFSYQGSDLAAIDVFQLLLAIDLLSLNQLLALFQEMNFCVLSFQQAPISHGTCSVQIICRKSKKEKTRQLITKLENLTGLIKLSHQAIHN